MLSEQMQIEAIKGALQGAPLSHPLEFFDGAYKRLAAMIGAANSRGIDPIEYLEPLIEADEEAAKVIVAATSPRPSGGGPKIRGMAEIQYPDTEWLYPGMLVRGQPNALLADAGTGKNWLALHIAKSVCNGRALCGANPNLTTKNVLWIDAEDFSAENKRRIEWWHDAGMFSPNGGEIYPFSNPSSGLIDLADPVIQGQLVDWMSQIKPDLVILDSWDMALVNNTFKSDVQDALIFVKRVAKAYNTCWITLCHPHKRKFSKPTDPLTPDEVAGSRLFKGLHRIIWAAWYFDTGDWSHSDPRVLSLAKSNYKRPETSKWVVDFQPLNPKGLRLDFQPYKMLEADEHDPLDAAAEWVEGLLHAAGSEGIKYSEIKKQAVGSPHGVKVVIEAVSLLQETGTCLNTIGPRARGNRLAHVNHAKKQAGRADARTRDST